MLGPVSHLRASRGVHRHRPWVAPLAPRSPEEKHRAATPLELFFDLVIVVAVAQPGRGLHQPRSEGPFGAGGRRYSWASSGLGGPGVTSTWSAPASATAAVG